jgi:myo-inositol-1(or 4)-monophosphatase
MRALLVHNPTAGTKGHDKDSIVEALQLADYKVVYVSTKEDDVNGALKEHYDLVVAAGGDGTVCYVFCHLADRSIPIGVMPFGSANNIARSLGIAGTPAELAEQWRIGRVQQFHLMNVAEDGAKEVSVEGFGVGLIPALIKRRAKSKKADGAYDIRRGRRALEEALHQIEPFDIEINIDGKPWKSDLISVEVLNIPFTGPALPLAHAADPTDKLLDVVVLEGDQRKHFAEWIRAPQETAPPVTARRGKTIHVRWHGADSRLDDELVKGKPKWRKVVLTSDPVPLHIMRPAKHPAVKDKGSTADEKVAKRARYAMGDYGAKAKKMIMRSHARECADAVDLASIEALAVELATLAGGEIMAAFGNIFTVRYKTGTQDTVSLRDPVSQIDSDVEILIRQQLTARYPDHGIIGEELAERPAHNSDFVWAVDPIDGTTNFINGFPLFAASIGVLQLGRPVAGAVWCSVSHALRAGVYHARAGGNLRFDGEDVTPKVNAAVLRRLAGVPVVANIDATGWETRKTGSAALECALVAAGLLEVSRFVAPNIWDVAGGIALVQAGGGVAREYDGERWSPMDAFTPLARGLEKPDLRSWRHTLVVGTAQAVARMCD